MLNDISEFDRAVSQHQVRLAELHYALDRISDSVLEMPARLNAVTQVIRLKLNCDVCSIYLLEPEEQHLLLRASTGLAPEAVNHSRLRLGEGVTGWVAEHLEAVALADAATDPRFKYLPETHEERFRSLLSVPVIADQSFLGVINVQHREIHPFTEYEQLLVRAIGYKVGAMIRSLRLEAALLRRQTDLDLLLWAGRAAAMDVSPDTLLPELLVKARRALSAQGGIVRRMDSGSKRLEVACTDGMGALEATLRPLAMGEGIAGRAAARGAAIRANSFPDFAPGLASASAISSSVLCVPFLDGGRVTGTLTLFDKQDPDGAAGFTEEDEQMLAGLAHLAALALRRDSHPTIPHEAVIRDQA